MTAITTQLSYYSPIQCLPPSVDTKNYTTDTQNSTEFPQLQLLRNSKEKLCNVNIAMKAKDDDSATQTSLMNTKLYSGMSYGLAVKGDSIVSAMDIKQKNQLVQPEQQREKDILYPESKDKESSAMSGTINFIDIKGSDKSVEGSCVIQFDSSSNYTYTIDAEKMVSSLCSSSNPKEDDVELPVATTISKKHCDILENAETFVRLPDNHSCDKSECSSGKSDDINSFQTVTGTSNSLPSASFVFCSGGNVVQENYLVSNRCSSLIISESGCNEKTSSSGIQTKYDAPKSNHTSDDVSVPDQCDTVYLNESEQKISVSCQTELNAVCGELQYTEKIIKLSEEILETLSSIPPSATVQAIAEICLSMKDCAQENNRSGNIFDNVMNNIVLSFLHVASSWMFLSSCNGLKSFVHLCHPPLDIIFKKWEAYSITLLDYMISFISESKISVAHSWNKQTLNGVIKHSGSNDDVLSMMQQSNYLSQNTTTNFNSNIPVNFSTESKKLFSNEIKLHKNFLFDCGGTTSSNLENVLTSETEKPTTCKSDLLNPLNSDNQEFQQVNHFVQNKTTPILNPKTLEAIKTMDVQFHMFPSKEQLEKNTYNFDNESLKIQTVDRQQFKTVNQQTLDSYLQMQRHQSPPNDLLEMVPPTSAESLNETEQNYFAPDTTQNSSLWLKTSNQQPILMHDNTAHIPQNNNGYYLDVQFHQTNDMYNAPFLPVTKKVPQNRKKYNRFRFTTEGNTKSVSFNRNYNFKKSNSRSSKSKTIPIRLQIESESSDENNEAIYMKPGSYIVPTKHVEEFVDFIPQYNTPQVLAQKSESSAAGCREISNNDKIWKTACASAAVFLQLVQEKNGIDTRTCSKNSDSSYKNESFSCDLKDSNDKQIIHDGLDIHGTELTSNLLSNEEINEMKAKSENVSNLQTQENYTVCTESNMGNSHSKMTSAGGEFPESATEIKSQDTIQECDETTSLDSQESCDLHKKCDRTSLGRIRQPLMNTREHKVPRKTFCKNGTSQFNNISICYKQPGLNPDVIIKLKSILNCIWNMEGSEFIKYPYVAETINGHGPENEKASDGVIGLQTVAYKLHNHLYSSIDQFVYDFNRIFHNSKANTMEDQQSSEISSLLCKRFYNLIEEHFCGLNVKFIHGTSDNIACTRNNFPDYHKKQNKKNLLEASSPKKSDKKNAETTVT